MLPLPARVPLHSPGSDPEEDLRTVGDMEIGKLREFFTPDDAPRAWFARRTNPTNTTAG